MSAAEPDRLISQDEAARLLGVHKRTLQRLAAAGRFPKPGRIGGKRVYSLRLIRSLVEKFAEAC